MCESCSPGHPQTFTVTGLVKFGTANNLAGATIAAFDLPTAQRLFDETGHYDAIDVLATPGVDKTTVQTAIARTLPRRGRSRDRPDRGQRTDQRHQPGPVVLLDGAPGVRVHLAVRRWLHHLQHVLDHRRPANPRARPAAHRRSQPTTGVSLRPPRGRHPRAGGVADRSGARRVGGIGSGGTAQGIRHHLAVGPARVRDTDRSWPPSSWVSG